MQLTNVPDTMNATMQRVGEVTHLHIGGKAPQLNLWDLVGRPSEHVKLKVTFAPKTTFGPHKNPFNLQLHEFKMDSQIKVEMYNLSLIAE